MSTSTTTTDCPWWQQNLVLLLVTGSFLPLLFWHIGGLLEKPHYQFLFLMPITVWMLVSSIPEREASGTLKRWEILTSASVLLVSLAGLAVAAWVWSPWLGAVCFQFAWGAAVLAQSGWRRSRDWLPLWFFTWIIIPLPFGMDEDLIVSLRGYTTRISSSVLDQIGVLHNSYANVIELPGKPLFIADACSGIHSLYVLMAAALFLCCWARRRFMHSLMLLASTFFLVLIENVARIVSVAVAWEKGRDWSTGSSHEMLGVCLFVLSLTIILTTDQLLKFILPSDAPSLYQTYKAWRRSRSDGEYFETKKSAGPTVIEAGPMLRRLAGGVSWMFPAMVVLQLFSIPPGIPDVMAVLNETYDLPALGEEALPEQLAGFTRVSHDTIARVPGDPFGQGSQQWTYRRGDLECLVSVDYPYQTPHDLTVCYTNIGWRTSRREILQPDQPSSIPSNMDVPVGIAEFTRPLYGHALVLFNHTNLNGDTAAILKDEVLGTPEQRAQRRWVSFAAPGSEEIRGASEEERTYLQFQLFVRSASELTEDQKVDLLAMFAEARELLVGRLQPEN